MLVCKSMTRHWSLFFDRRVGYIIKFYNTCPSLHASWLTAYFQTVKYFLSTTKTNQIQSYIRNKHVSFLGKKTGSILFGSIFPLSLTLFLSFSPLVVLSLFISSPRSSPACWLYCVKLQRKGQHDSTFTCPASLKACELNYFQADGQGMGNGEDEGEERKRERERKKAR